MLIKNCRKLAKSKFVRSVVVVASGTAGAQLITMVFSPIVTRVYGPEVFGVLGTFSAILGILAPIAALGYPIAIVLPRDDRDSMALVKLSLCVALIFSVLTAIVLASVGDYFFDLFGIQQIEGLSVFLPVALLGSVSMTVASQWMIRKKLFRIGAKVDIGVSFFSNALKTGLGLFSPTSFVLIFSTIVQTVVHALVLFSAVKREQKESVVSAQEQSLSSVARQYIAFPLYRAPQGFVASINQSIPVVMLAALFGPAAAGYYSLCRTVLFMPVTLISKSVNDVIYPKFNECRHEGKSIRKLLVKSTLVLAALALPPFVTVIFFGDVLFSFVFGEEWAVAGKYAEWLSIWFIFNFINRPSVAAIPVLGIEKILLVNSVFNFILSVTGFSIGYYVFSSDVWAVALFSIFGVAPQIILISSALIAAGKFNNSLSS